MKLFGSLPSLPFASKWLGAAATLGFVAAVSAGGCGGDPTLSCDENGNNCQICDGYGCHPATPQITGSGGSGGTGGATGGSTGGTGGGTGGSAPCDPKEATCPCDENNTCKDGLTCVMGLCISGCNFSYECGPGKVCFDGACVPGCSEQSPCDPGYVCQSGACVPDTNNPECDETHPCPTGEICAKGLCSTGCNANTDCKSGEVCDGSAHACIPDPSPKPLCSTSKPCSAPQVCKDDGYCHYPCAALTECKLIDNRFVACDQGVCKTQEEVAPECSLDKPCPAGMNCISNKCE
ncbi:18K peptidoglycan-associated outer membrane lipoprotein [Minicystis rosea]|nr:18K peptidoglycan-associated outer membrane lipoprotein [Minicystis rosea]